MDQQAHYCREYSGALVILLSVVKAFICEISVWLMIKQIIQKAGHFAIVMFPLNSVGQFLTLTCDELQKDSDWEVALFNKFTLCFYPTFLWFTIIITLNA